MLNRKRYAVVGLGARSRMYTTALLADFREHGMLVGYCDLNQTRMDYYNRYYAEHFDAQPVPTYKPDAFERMIREQQVDSVIVTSTGRSRS